VGAWNSLLSCWAPLVLKYTFGCYEYVNRRYQPGSVEQPAELLGPIGLIIYLWLL